MLLHRRYLFNVPLTCFRFIARRNLCAQTAPLTFVVNGQRASSKMATQQPTTTSARPQPPWRAPPSAPASAGLPPLEVYNSLTKNKTPFVPLDWKNKKVSLYACGVTPYDDSHLGHIRNYTTLDIIVRTLRDYFKYDVHFVMNVTDVDDKIILRARQRHLLAEFEGGRLAIDGKRVPEDLVELGSEALVAYGEKNLQIYFHGNKSTDAHQMATQAHAAVSKKPRIGLKRNNWRRTNKQKITCTPILL